MYKMEWLKFSIFFVLLNIFSCSTQWVVDDTGCRTPDGNVGDCISILSCSTMTNFLLKTNTSSFDKNSRKYIRRYLCGTDARGLKVCCPRTPVDLSNFIIDNSRQNNTSKFTSGKITARRIMSNKCRTAAHDDGICTKLQSCETISNLILKIKDFYKVYREEAFELYNRHDLSRPNIWCESAGREIPELFCKELTSYLSSINGTESDEIQSFLDLYQCRKKVKKPKVCCPEKADLTFHPNSRLLANSDCIYTRAVNPNFIYGFGGEPAFLSEFPWMAALKYSVNRSETQDFRCGASLISKRYLLTAAHCITSKTSGISLIGAILGEIDLKRAGDSPDFEITEEDAIVHPDFNPKSLANDIALIRLRKEVRPSWSIGPIDLPICLKTRSNDLKGEVTVTGWGETESGFRSRNLLKINVPVISHQNCSKSYENIMNITSKQLCAGGEDARNTCRGDSGGPLMSNAYFNFQKRTIQYGVVSLGTTECAKKNFPTVYTRITSYLTWILDNIKP